MSSGPSGPILLTKKFTTAYLKKIAKMLFSVDIVKQIVFDHNLFLWMISKVYIVILYRNFHRDICYRVNLIIFQNVLHDSRIIAFPFIN